MNAYEQTYCKGNNYYPEDSFSNENTNPQTQMPIIPNFESLQNLNEFPNINVVI